MNILGNTAFLRLITFNYKITINQSVQMLEVINNYAITNQKGEKFYSLQPCTFESGVHNLELVQSALHRHKYTHFSYHNGDVVQFLFYLW